MNRVIKNHLKSIVNDTKTSEIISVEDKEDSMFFKTERVNNFFSDKTGYDGRYGIGFGEYDCEIYFQILKDAEKGETCEEVNDFDLNKLEWFENEQVEEKTGKRKFIRTFYKEEIEDKDKIVYNYSKFVLASKVLKDEAHCGKYTRSTIDNSTINSMVDELLELEKNLLKIYSCRTNERKNND